MVKRCLPVTDRKLELGRIRTLARRHDVSRMSGVVEPDLHIADSLQYKPTPHLRTSCISLAQNELKSNNKNSVAERQGPSEFPKQLFKDL